MSTFTLAISCSNLPWFMDLTFQVIMQYCSLQHRTLLLSAVPSTTVYCVYFGTIPSFFLKLFLHWYPVSYWAPTDLGSSSFRVLSFCLFILFIEFSRQEYGSGLSFLLEWTTFCHTSPPWPVRLGWPHMAWPSIIELEKAVVHVIRWLVICDCGFSLPALWCPLSGPTVFLGFLLPCTWGMSSRLLLLTLDVGLLLSAACHSCATQPPLSCRAHIYIY